MSSEMSQMAREFKWLICGDLLGEGVARKVYSCMLNDAYVVKIERKARSFQNVAEWDTWSWAKGSPRHARWLAPCALISPCGAVMAQRKVVPLRPEELPTRLPAWLCDLKRENFGLLDGKVVCCDYGTVNSAIRDASTKLVKATWASEVQTP